MGRQVVGIIVELLDVLAMVAFLIAKPKKPFFEDGVLPVPQCYCETKVLKKVRDAAQSVFSPEIRPAMRMVVRKIMPCIAIRAIVLSYRSPLPLTQIRAPLF